MSISKKIAVIPLDNRPCCQQFPNRLGEISGFEVIQPPVQLLGQFTKPGKCEEIKSWLQQIAGEVSGLVIAIDQLAFGGLVASRTYDRSLEACLSTLQVIPEMKKSFPNLNIYVANVLMRITITSKNKEYSSYSSKVFKYSQLHDRVYRLGELDNLAELEQLEQEIPDRILQEYLDARARNHEINKRMVDWAELGYIDYLTITQEDANSIGMHLSEQKILMELIYNKKVQGKVMIYPGADEAVQTLLSRLIQHLEDRKIRIYPRYSSTSGRLVVAAYEDRPVEETVKCHILAAGGICVEQVDEADVVLFVNTPMSEWNDWNKNSKMFFDSRHNLWDIVEGIKYEISQGRRVALADTAICNASDLELIQYLLQEKLYLSLIAYAGWNTAGNTLGTVISHAIARTIYMDESATHMNMENEQAHYSFMIERLMDEWAYQAQVRGDVNQWITTELTSSANDLEDDYDIVNERVREQLFGKFEQLQAVLLTSSLQKLPNQLKLNQMHIEQMYLPWNRTFEIFVEVGCGIEKITNA